MNKCVICNKEIKNDSQFVKGKWYHNDCIENLNNIINKLEKTLTRTKRKNVKTKKLELENKKYREMVEQLQNKIKYDDYLKEENKKMIEWIQKILKEFGTNEVRERNITIPIMRHKDFSYDANNNMRYTTETIIIPEIILHKGEY